jgi:hypothetical protein
MDIKGWLDCNGFTNNSALIDGLSNFSKHFPLLQTLNMDLSVAYASGYNIFCSKLQSLQKLRVNFRHRASLAELLDFGSQKRNLSKLTIKCNNIVLWPRSKTNLDDFTSCRKVSPTDFKFDFHFQAQKFKLKVLNMAWS